MRHTQHPSPNRRPDPDDDAPTTNFWLRWRVISLAIAAVLLLPAARQAYNWYEKSQDVRDKQTAMNAPQGRTCATSGRAEGRPGRGAGRTR